MPQAFHQICHQHNTTRIFVSLFSPSSQKSLYISPDLHKCASAGGDVIIHKLPSSISSDVKTQHNKLFFFCAAGFACVLRVVIISYGSEASAPSFCARCVFNMRSHLPHLHNRRYSATKQRPAIRGGGDNLDVLFRCDLATCNCSDK